MNVPNFEILCVTMNQKDFSKIQEMNIKSNVVFANQTDITAYEEIKFDKYIGKMISTTTRGVGVNRNICLMYASADICLLADDDLRYYDDVENKVVNEFNKYPDADIIIFHFETNSNLRKQKKYIKTKKISLFTSKGWGAFRIAFRRKSIQKANIWFSTLFGGGAVFPSGEDSMWINDVKNKGLNIYVSKETLGIIDFSHSTWFTGYDEKYYWGVGICNKAMHKRLFWLYYLYFSLRTYKIKGISIFRKLYLLFKGGNTYTKY